MAKDSAPPDSRFIDFNFSTGCVYALGMTYADHLRETGEKSTAPVVFLKRGQPMHVDRTHVQTPSSGELLETLHQLDPSLAAWLGRRFPVMPALFDYEVELGLVLLEDISLQQLNDASHVPQIGLFVANDLTARSVQIAGEGSADKLRFWSAAKSFPDFLAVGARIWCATAPQLDSWPELTLQTRVNGQIRQSASSQQMIYTPRQMLQFAAQAAPAGLLRKNDLVLTGTPAGVALSVPRWMRRLAVCLPRRQRIRAALRANTDNSRFLNAGDELVFSAGWLGSRTLHIEDSRA